MAKAPLFNTSGRKLKNITLPKEVFSVKVHPSLIAQALHVYRSNSHQSTSKVKTRGEVIRTKAKWFRQKGTGRARHGARSAPIFVGGGVAHGPKGLKKAAKKLPTKVARLALKGALTSQASSVTLITGLDKLENKTKPLNQLITKLNLPPKTLTVTAANYPNLKSAAANIPSLTILPAQTTNAYQILKARHLLIDDKALEIYKTWLK